MADTKPKMTTVEVGGTTYRVREDQKDAFLERMGATEEKAPAKAKTTATNKAETAPKATK